MNAFAAGVNALFADPNLAVDALWRAGGAGEGVPVRVIRARADVIGDYGSGRYVTDTLRIDVRVSQVPTLESGDTFEIASELFEVRGEPIRDAERLVWSAEARPA